MPPSTSIKPPPPPLSFSPKTRAREPPGCSCAPPELRLFRRQKAQRPVNLVDPELSCHALSFSLECARRFDMVRYFFLAPQRAAHPRPRPPAAVLNSGEQSSTNQGTTVFATSPPAPTRHHARRHPLIQAREPLERERPRHRAVAAAHRLLRRLAPPRGKTLECPPSDPEFTATIRSYFLNRYADVAAQSVHSQPSQPIRDSHVARDFQ